ncbi:hypothetical protein KEM54_005752 [Ascosphaera aggregata]|nr:hypothetical protein KEM54_005752 [Ascosphaera aggregata]
MVHALDDERALQLVRDAHELLDSGHRKAASRNLREAMALSPNNTGVQSAFQQIAKQDELNHPLCHLVRRYVDHREEKAGKEALAFFGNTEDSSKSTALSGDAAKDCFTLILSVPAARLDSTQDEILTSLARCSGDLRRHLAAEMQASVTQLFDQLYDRGDGIVGMLVTIILDESLWHNNEDQRRHCESELFVLFVAKLLESGYDLRGVAVSGLARLLAVHAEQLAGSLDEEGIDAIIAGLDIRLPSEIRAQATIVLAKYLEVTNEDGERILSQLILKRVQMKKYREYIVSFSALAATYSMIPTTSATILWNDDVKNTLANLTDPRSRPSDDMVKAILTLFNSTTIDRSSRQYIYKEYADWLSHTVSNARNEVNNALAALTLAKLRASEGNNDPFTNTNSNNAIVEEVEGSTHDLVERFKKLLSASNPAADLSVAIEGLAYTSVQPDVKEQLLEDSTLIPNLLRALKAQITAMGSEQQEAPTSTLYGGLVVLWNLTRYRPNMSEEQKRISDLKAYANASKPSSSDAAVLDDDEHVQRRCDAVVEAGVMPLLRELWSSAGKGGFVLTASVQELMTKILLSITRNQKIRGLLAQQGAVRLLIAMLDDSVENTGRARLPPEAVDAAANALARLLISLDPKLIFNSNGFPQITSAVRPLVRLLSAPAESKGFNPSTTDQPRDLLPTFEALLALTNLASYPDNVGADTIVRLAWDDCSNVVLEDLLLSSNERIQRAACELVCNLTCCPRGVAKFVDNNNNNNNSNNDNNDSNAVESKRCSQRIHLLLALADAHDQATRLAAGGALASLTAYRTVVEDIINRPRGIELILSMCVEDDDDGQSDEGLVHRGLVCILNMCEAEDGSGERAKEALKKAGAAEKLGMRLKEVKAREVLEVGIMALKHLI